MFPRDTRGFHAVLRTQLADVLGEAVAHRSSRKVQHLGDLARGLPDTRPPQYMPLAVGQRIRLAPRFRGQRGIDSAAIESGADAPR